MLPGRSHYKVPVLKNFKINMVTSLLSVLGTFVQQILVTVALSLSVSSGFLSGQSVKVSDYAGALSKPAVTLSNAVSGGAGIGADARPLSSSTAASSGRDTIVGPPVVEAGEDTVASSGKIAKKIGVKIDRIVDRIEPNMNTDSILGTTIGLPVPDRTEEDVVESVSAALSPFDENVDGDDIERIAMIVTLIITIVCFGIPFISMIIIIGLILNSRVKYQRERLRVIENIAMSGQTIPDELRVAGRMTPYERRRRFSSAIRWLAVGIGVMLFFGLVARSLSAVVTFGIVPFLIGAVKLALYFYDTHMADNAEECETRVFPPQFTGLDDDKRDNCE